MEVSKQDVIEKAVRAFLKQWATALASPTQHRLVLSPKSFTDLSGRTRLDESLIEALSRMSKSTDFSQAELIDSALVAWLDEHFDPDEVDYPRLASNEKVEVSLFRSQVNQLDELTRVRAQPRARVLQHIITTHLDMLAAWYNEHPGALTSPFGYSRLFSIQEARVTLSFEVESFDHLRMGGYARRDDVTLSNAYDSVIVAGIEELLDASSTSSR